jgi:hypothetical protein
MPRRGADPADQAGLLPESAGQATLAQVLIDFADLRRLAEVLPDAHGLNGHRQPCDCNCGRCACTQPAPLTPERKARLRGALLLCSYYHQVCVHWLGWTLTLHPDGTTEAPSPDGQILHSHGPPTARAG